MVALAVVAEEAALEAVGARGGSAAAEEAALETVGARGGSAAAAVEVGGAREPGPRPRGSSQRTSAVIASQGLV